MEIRAHDARKSFDYCGFINACFDRAVEHDRDPEMIAMETGYSVGFIYKVFRYEPISVPSMIVLADYFDLHLLDFVIKID